MQGINHICSLFKVCVLFVSLCIFQNSIVVAVPKPDILIVGDSMGKYMGNTLESLCKRSAVQNAAISGSTADEWANFTPDDLGEGCQERNWDVVYIAIGGNDLLKGHCELSAKDLAEKVLSAVTNIVEVVTPNADRYLLHGYCMPSSKGAQITHGCTNPSQFAIFKEVYSLIEEQLPDKVTLIDSSDECGGSATKFSDNKYFQDKLHLNKLGYCKVFTHPDIQQFLTCGEQFLDCDSQAPPITGVDKQCQSDVDIRKTCSDDSTWLLNGKKTCVWVSRNPYKRCKRKANNVRGTDACPIVCSNPKCTMPSCENDDEWRVTVSKGERAVEKKCNYIKKKPFRRCRLVGDNGMFGYEACCDFCKHI